MANLKNANSFCVLPWIHSFVNLNGNYQVCCTSEEYHHQIDDSNGRALNMAMSPSFDSVMNADFYKALRLKMLNGDWDNICTRCLNIEKSGGKSRRNLENDNYSPLISELIANTKDDGTISPKFKSVDYRLGNLCNLKCRMCHPQATIQWVKDWNLIQPEKIQCTEDQLNEYSKYDWVESNFVIEDFREKLPVIDRLHFAGGEPLLTPQVHQILEECIKAKRSDQIVLSFNTNISQLPRKVLDMWKQFKEVRLLCSVDAYGKLNEYIRPPSKWSVIDTNLVYLDNNWEQFNISSIILSTTVQFNNILNLDQLYIYLRKFKKIVPALNLINLHEPFFFQTTLLPQQIKREAECRLLKVVEENIKLVPVEYLYLLDNVKDVTNFMRSDDHPYFLNEYRRATAQADKYFNKTLKEYNPELNQLLIDYYLSSLQSAEF